MMLDTIDIDRSGFAPQRPACAQVRRTAAIFQVIISLALVLSTVVAMTVVSIGIARADALAAAAEDPTAHIAAAIPFALVLVGIDGLTSLLSHGRSEVKRSGRLARSRGRPVNRAGSRRDQYGRYEK